MGENHELIVKAISDHRVLKALFENKVDIEDNLKLIEDLLEKHIRFEERLLFNDIQQVATYLQLKRLLLIE